MTSVLNTTKHFTSNMSVNLNKPSYKIDAIIIAILQMRKWGLDKITFLRTHSWHVAELSFDSNPAWPHALRA